jgi:oligopeptide/dipeptide ABC transporter ATP-binding protein
MVLSGEVPSPLNPPAACRFHPRCPHAMPRCSTEEPVLRETDGRQVSCHLYASPA